MRKAKALAAVCWCTGAASCWLVVMYFVLRHPGYQWRAAITALFVGQSALTLVVFSTGRPKGLHYPTGKPEGLRYPTDGLARLHDTVARVILLAGSVGTIWAGYSAISATLTSPHFEGFWLPSSSPSRVSARSRLDDQEPLFPPLNR